MTVRDAQQPQADFDDDDIIIITAILVHCQEEGDSEGDDE
jgi:hypothetical protein